MEYLSTHSEERFVNELKEVGRSPEKLLWERSLQGNMAMHCFGKYERQSTNEERSIGNISVSLV